MRVVHRVIAGCASLRGTWAELALLLALLLAVVALGGAAVDNLYAAF
jgi:hypothetical protein